MSVLHRIRDWWVSQFKQTGRLGKVALLAAPLLFACCGVTWFSAQLSPPDVEPTAELADRAGAVEATAALVATQELVEIEPTAAPAEGQATRAAAPTATEELATVTPRPSATSQPATATVAPSATAVPPTAVPPTAVLPTAVPPTAVPPTAAPPTALPLPTATLPTAAGQLVITNVNKREEFVDIQNTGGTEVVLDGWTLRSEKGPQDCRLNGVLGPGQSLRIWAMSEDAGQGGFNCNMGSEIWNNSEPDAAVLINPEGAEVSRR